MHEINPNTGLTYCLIEKGPAYLGKHEKSESFPKKRRPCKVCEFKGVEVKKLRLGGFWNENLATVVVPIKTKISKKERRRLKLNARSKSRLLSAGVPKSLGPPHPDYIKGDVAFYQSREWRTLRYAALKNCGGKCQCCGAGASDGTVIHVDHIKPRYKFPSLSLEITNLQVLCEDCNIGKGAWDSTDWRDHMRAIK